MDPTNRFHPSYYTPHNKITPIKSSHENVSIASNPPSWMTEFVDQLHHGIPMEILTRIYLSRLSDLNDRIRSCYPPRLQKTVENTLIAKFSQTGKYLALVTTDGNDKIIIIDAHSGDIKQILTDPVGGFSSFSFSPSDNELATTSFNLRDISIWNIHTGQITDVIPIQDVNSVTYNPNQNIEQLTCRKQNTTIEIWQKDETKTWKRREIIPNIISLLYSPQGHTMATVNERMNNLEIRDTRTLQVQSTIPFKNLDTLISYSRDELYIALSISDLQVSKLNIYNVLAGTKEKELQFSDEIRGLDFDPTQDILAVALMKGYLQEIEDLDSSEPFEEGQIQFINTKTWKPVSAEIPIRGEVARGSLSYNPDGSQLKIEAFTTSPRTLIYTFPSFDVERIIKPFAPFVWIIYAAHQLASHWGKSIDLSVLIQSIENHYSERFGRQMEWNLRSYFAGLPPKVKEVLTRCFDVIWNI